VRRTSLEIDEERLTQAQKVLGTTGVKDTIDRALEEVLRADLRRRLADRIRTGRGVDRSGAILEASRRWRR
jgi:Arc/MetJ family transcription regulator